MHTKTTNADTPDTQRCGFSRVSATALVVAGALLLGLSAPPAAASAQIRCWTNDSGSRECSDMPPPPNAKGVNEIRGRAGRIEGQDSFAQRQASDRFPVTLSLAIVAALMSTASRKPLSVSSVNMTPLVARSLRTMRCTPTLSAIFW